LSYAGAEKSFLNTAALDDKFHQLHSILRLRNQSADKTWNNRRSYLSTFFGFCVTRAWRRENPALEVSKFRKAQLARNEIVIRRADVALMNNDLRRIADLIEFSHRTVGTINQNLLCGFTFIIIAVTLSALGFITPVAAAFFHEFSAFFVIFNSARLLRFDGLENSPPPASTTLELASPAPRIEAILNGSRLD